MVIPSLFDTWHCVINFQFPEVCDYHDAIYAVSILTRDRKRIHQSADVFYDGDGPQNVEVDVRKGMDINTEYIAVINVTTAVKSTTTEFAFSKHLCYDNSYINHFIHFRYQYKYRTYPTEFRFRLIIAII